jgi:hypothetical protein
MVFLISVMSLGRTAPLRANQQGVASRGSPRPTRTEGLAAWQQMYSVMTHPRCINCHTATDHPDQADDRHAHNFHVVRGPTGVGVPGLNCATCHQSANADSTGVPGVLGWHLAPLSMTWQDKGDKIFDSAALCRAVTDRKKNENMDGAAILKHHADAPLVKWAWAPGRRAGGTERTVPPITHAQFVTATSNWVAAGTPCP